MSTDQPTAPSTAIRPLSDGDYAFNLIQRKAKAFAESALVPDHFRGKVADCIVAFEYAELLRISPLIVMMSLYVVKGRASWSAQFMIGRANASGAFQGRIKFDVVDHQRRIDIDRTTKGGKVKASVPDLTVTAWAVDADTSQRVEVSVSMRDAILEGWTDNEKYSGRALGEQMLCYRAATMLIRRTCPDVLMGGMTDVEAEDLAVVDMGTGEVISPARRQGRSEPRDEPKVLPDSGPRQELLPESPALQGQERVPVGREPGDDRDDDGPPSM